MEEKICVNRIIDRELVIDLDGLLYQKGEISKEVGCQDDLVKLDSNGDGVLEVRDLTEQSAYLPRQPFSCVIQSVAVKAFVESGLISSGSKEEAVKHLFKLYNRLKALDDIIVSGKTDWGEETSVASWSQVHSDTWGRELEFDNRAYWERHVEPYVTGRGLLTNFHDYDMGVSYSYEIFMQGQMSVTGRGLGYQLAEEMRMMLVDMCGVRTVKGDKRRDAPSVYHEIDSTGIPEIVRRQAREMIGWYNGIAKFLDSYRELECDGYGCGIKDEYELHSMILIKDIAPSGVDPEQD